MLPLLLYSVVPPSVVTKVFIVVAGKLEDESFRVPLPLSDARVDVKLKVD